MHPHLPRHVLVPYHHTGAQRQLPNPTIMMINKLSLGKSDTQQQRRMIVVRFQSQICSLQLRETVKTHSLKSTTQLFSQFAFYIGTNIPSDWESLIRLDLLCRHRWILLIQGEERRVTMQPANTHAQPSQYLWQPVLPKTARVHTHVFPNSGLYLAVEALNLSVGACTTC